MLIKKALYALQTSRARWLAWTSCRHVAKSWIRTFEGRFRCLDARMLWLLRIRLCLHRRSCYLYAWSQNFHWCLGLLSNSDTNSRELDLVCHTTKVLKSIATRTEHFALVQNPTLNESHVGQLQKQNYRNPCWLRLLGVKDPPKNCWPECHTSWGQMVDRRIYVESI